MLRATRILSVALLVIPTLLAGDAPPPPDNGLDLTDLQAQADQSSEAAKKWDVWLTRMKGDFAKVRELEQRPLTVGQKAAAWDRFLKAYGNDDPFSREDEELRLQATAAKAKWSEGSSDTTTAIAAPPTGIAAVIPSEQDPQLVAMRAAYRLAKKTDLGDAPAASKIAAWEAFLREQGGDLPGTVDDDMRMRAEGRIEFWRAGGSPAAAPSPAPAGGARLGAAVNPDLTVSSVSDGGNAARLGIRAGDSLVMVNGSVVSNLPDLKAALATVADPGAWRIRISRAGQLINLPMAAAESGKGVRLGAAVKGATDLTVTGVTAGSPAARLGVLAGDRLLAVNGTAISTATELKAALAAAGDPFLWTLRVERAGQAIELR